MSETISSVIEILDDDDGDKQNDEPIPSSLLEDPVFRNAENILTTPEEKLKRKKLMFRVKTSFKSKKNLLSSPDFPKIPPTNKGNQMLAKMGYEPGTSLGKRNDGILEPIVVSPKIGRLGLGQVTSNDNECKKAKVIDLTELEESKRYLKSSTKKSKASNKKKRTYLAELSDESDWDNEDQDEISRSGNCSIIFETKATDSLETEYQENCNNMIGSAESDEKSELESCNSQEPYVKENSILRWANFKAQILNLLDKDGKITNSQYRILKRCLVMLIEKAGMENPVCPLRFHRTYLNNCIFTICCANQHSLDWLIENVPKMTSLWKNAKFRVISASGDDHLDEDKESMTSVKIIVKETGLASGTILKRLNLQNPELITEKWLFHDCFEIDYETHLHVSVDQESLNAIMKLDFQPFIGLTRTCVIEYENCTN